MKMPNFAWVWTDFILQHVSFQLHYFYSRHGRNFGLKKQKMKNFLSVTFAENIENEETSVVTEHENDICKSYCGTRRLYKKSKSLLHKVTLITWWSKTVFGLNSSKSKT